MLRIFVLGASAIAGIAAANRSRQSRAGDAHGDEYQFEARTAQNDLDWQQVSPPAAVEVEQAGADSEAPGNSWATVLAVQLLLSLLLIVAAPWLRPASIPELAWMQGVAVTCVAALALPLAASLGRRTPAQSAAASAAAAPPPLSASALPVAVDAFPDAPFTRVHELAALNGVYLKDKEHSDSVEPACDLVHLHGLVRLAIGLIKGVEIDVTPGERFKFAALSGIGWFKLIENYPLGGEGSREVRHRRRDLRGGGVFGLACEAPSGGILLHSRFNDPHAGTIDEHFYLNSADTLHVDAVMKVGQGRVQYRQVYRRQL